MKLYQQKTRSGAHIIWSKSKAERAPWRRQLIPPIALTTE
jgi:hypothetical protein